MAHTPSPTPTHGTDSGAPPPAGDPRPGAAEPSAPVVDPEIGVVVPAKLPPASDQPREERL